MALGTTILRSRGRAGIVLALSACTIVVGTAGGGWRGDTAVASTARGAASAAPLTLKPVNTGLMMRAEQPPPAALASVVHGYILEVEWNHFQPNGPSDFVSSYQDWVVGQVRAWNAAHPTNKRGLRLRVSAGVFAPGWVKAMSGGPVTITSPYNPPGTVPRWWTQPVIAAYAAFVAKLAAHFDSVPEVREASVGLTMDFHDEIFHRLDVPALTAAGWTQALDIAAMQASFRAHAAFQHTTTLIDVDGYVAFLNLAVTGQLMAYARGVLPAVMFANAALHETGYLKLYALMTSFGPRGSLSNPSHLTFQTLPVVSNVVAVIQRANTLGATSVELPANPGPASVLASLDAALQKGR